jgi:hypothetical protein
MVVVDVDLRKNFDRRRNAAGQSQRPYFVQPKIAECTPNSHGCGENENATPRNDAKR